MLGSNGEQKQKQIRLLFPVMQSRDPHRARARFWACRPHSGTGIAERFRNLLLRNDFRSALCLQLELCRFRRCRGRSVMGRKAIRISTLLAVLLLPLLILVAQQTNVLLIDGKDGQAGVIQVRGKNYVALDELTRITGDRYASQEIKSF
jgi:hypothetical protein